MGSRRVTHSFDTGGPLAQRTALRRGAVTLLTQLARPTGYLQAVISWGGTVESKGDHPGLDELYKALNGRSPAIAVSLADRSPTGPAIGGFASKSEIEIDVFFFSNHNRDLLSRLEIDPVGVSSDVADPGLDIAMEHVEELLVGKYPSVMKSIKQLRFVSEEPITSIPECTIWLQRYAVTVDRVINPNRTITDMVTEFFTIVRTSGLNDPPVAQVLSDVDP